MLRPLTGLLAFILGMVAPARTQQLPQAPPTFQLDTSLENPILAPNFVRSAVALCDERGYAYFPLTTPQYASKYILRVSDDGRDATPFQLPSDLDKGGFWHFYIDNGGTIYALYSTPADAHQKHILIEISNSGEEIRRTELKLPPRLGVAAFATLPSGRTMVHGRVTLPVQPAKDGKDPPVEAFSYTAWLDANGTLLHDTGTDPKKQKTFDFSTRNDTAVTAGPGDTFLSISGASLNMYESNGELLHTSTIAKPDKNTYTTSIQFVDGQAAIGFYVAREVSTTTPDSGGATDSETTKKALIAVPVWLLVDPNTGTMHGFYKLPDDFKGSAVCYLGNRDFLYFAVSMRRPILVDAHPK